MKYQLLVVLVISIQSWGSRPSHQESLQEEDLEVSHGGSLSSDKEQFQVKVDGEPADQQITFMTFKSGDPDIHFPQRWLSAGEVDFTFPQDSPDILSYLLFAYSLKGLQIPPNKPEYWSMGWKLWQAVRDFSILKPTQTQISINPPGSALDFLLATPAETNNIATESVCDQTKADAVEFMDGMSGTVYDAVKPLMELESISGNKVSIVVPWYRFCQMDRTSKTFTAPDGTVTKNPEDASLALGAIDDAATIDLPVSELYFRFMLHAASKGGARPVEIEFNDAHEPLPLIQAAQEVSQSTGQPMQVKLTSSFKFYLKTIAEQLHQRGSNQKFVLVAPDKGQWDRITAIMNEYKTEDNAMFQKLSEKITLATFAALRLPGAENKIQTCCYTKEEADAGALLSPAVGEEKALMETWAKSILDGMQPVKDDVTIPAAAAQLDDPDRCPLRFLIVDDFTNSGSTLFKAAVKIRKALGLIDPAAAKKACVSAFVSHLLAQYDQATVTGLLDSVNKGVYKGDQALDQIVVTTSIPLTVRMLGQFEDGSENDGNTPGKGAHFEVVSRSDRLPTGHNPCTETQPSVDSE